MGIAAAVQAGCTVDIAGLPFQLRGSGPERAAVVAYTLGGSAPNAGPPQATIRFLRRRPRLPARPPTTITDDIRWWDQGQRLFLLHNSGVGAAATENDVWVGGDADELFAPFQRQLLPALTHLLAHHDRFLLHGAAVGIGDGACVVVGGSGEGKSTVALAALRAGWPVLADDMVVIRQGPSGPEVAGIARPGAVPGDLEPTVLARQPIRDSRGRYELAPRDLHRGWLPVRLVVRTGHNQSGRGELVPLPPRDALHAVIGAFTSARMPWGLHRFFPYAAALSRLPAFHLRHGTAPEHRLGEAVSLLAAVAAAGERGSSPVATI